MTDNPEQKYDYETDEEFLRRVSTRALGDTDFEENQPKWGTAHFSARTNLVVYIRGAQEPFVFDAGSIDELVIGRFDPDTQTSPQIDLQSFGGTEKGVSRRHATIVKREGALNIVDAGSYNGTYLNGQRLVAHQPRILRDGDDIRLGYLVLRVKFVKANNPS
ncbi:MAG: FHA domain-containing protein [Anaerolineae bacterium]|nr:FHA domain-containing protein [Anaerolineae bacterium]